MTLVFPALPPDLVRALHARAGAARWEVPIESWTRSLDRTARARFGDEPPARAVLQSHFESLHLSDLALACACEDGHSAAWDHLVIELRPILYRAARAIAGEDEGRELADSLWAELFGLEERDGRRRSLLAYYHGRSALASWMRAVLSQRHVDRVRARRRLDPLPDDAGDRLADTHQAEPPDPKSGPLAAALAGALRAAISNLDADDRLRLAMYYGQGLTLAQIGRLFKEHEATVSRKLDRTRKRLREAVERDLRAQGASPQEMALAFESAAAGNHALDLGRSLDTRGP
jgi:RNA polymerase sigma-70 factor (ECF subfamily)